MNINQRTGVSTFASCTSPSTDQSLQKSFHLSHADKIELKKISSPSENKKYATAQPSTTKTMTVKLNNDNGLLGRRTEGLLLTAVWRNGGFSASYDSFVVGSSAVLRLNICAKNPPLRQAAKRYAPFLKKTTIMKKLILTTATTMLIAFTASAQDKIIMRSGDTLIVKITKTTPEVVEFTYPNEDLVNTEYKNAIEKIVYSSGREEICSQKNQLQKINGPNDWEKVVITYTESDVKGLTKVGQITKTSGWGGTMATGLGYKDALKKIQKEAAKQGASIVWITDKPNEHTTQYGAGVKLTGIAYK